MKKQKEAWGIFSFFLPQMLKRRTSALLPITRSLTRMCSQLTARNGLNKNKMETSLKTIKNLHATDHGFTDWQDLRESVQDDIEYEQHWHAVCVRAQEQALSNLYENLPAADWQALFDEITNKQNLVR